MPSEPPHPSFAHGRVALPTCRTTPHDNGPERFLTIALSVQASEHPQRFLWAQANGFALEYTPDPLSSALISRQVTPFAQEGVPVRFHCRFFDHELGNADPAKAEEAFRVHSRVIKAIAGLGEPVITVHLNLVPRTPFDPQRGVENLTRLVEQARRLGITVCLENLRRGPTSDPSNVLAWAEASGAMVTMDVGHAVSSELVQSGGLTVPDIVDLFGDRLYEVHMYAREEDRHHPIDEMTELGPVVDRLLTTACTWWTIEIDNHLEALRTRKSVITYLGQ